MTPESESPVIAELRVLLDALVEESITPEQVKRLEELVLTNPEAEAYYIQFMSLHADLIGHIAGLPQPPTRVLPASPASPAPAKSAKKPISPHRLQMAAAIFLVFGGIGGVIAYQVINWRSKSDEIAKRQAEIDANKAELARLLAEQEASRAESRKELDAASATERKVAADYQASLEAARKAIKEKEFVVRLNGPTHIQPGAPNIWQIETLRQGTIAAPRRMDVVVKDMKDGKDTEIFRQTHDKPGTVTPLELSPAFWTKVKPGSELFLEVIAFNDDDRKNAVTERIPLGRPVYVTHLATDKPLYKPGEIIRFRSLTLDRSSLRPPEHDLHLQFSLRDPSNAETVVDIGNGRLLRDMQPVLGPDKKPLRGIGVGEHQLPETAPGGEYKLEVYETNTAGKKTLIETRKFIVNRYVPDTFEKKLEFDGKSYGAGEFVQARIEVSRTAGGPMKNAIARITASVDGSEFHKEAGKQFDIVTENGVSKAVLNVRFQIPADIYEKAPKPDVPPNATLSVNIFDGESETIVRPIPLVTRTLNVQFFPEGGDMVESVPGRIYFQVRTPIGKPADLKGYITDGTNKIVDVGTETDAENPGVNRGHGKFELTPKAGARYFLKIVSPLGILEPSRDGFPLPIAKTDGVALTALDSVTKKGGAVRIQLATARGPKTLHVGAYARGRLIAHQKLTLEANSPTKVELQGDEAAGGVTRVTVFEEKDAKGNVIPRAERLVYRGPGEQLVLNATPDHLRYTPSGKVRLELSATNEKGTPTPAILLVGVVNQSVITMADNKTDRLMPTHFLLSGDVKHPAELEHADFLLTDHPKAGIALDLLLGTQGWRRFAEQELPPAPSDKAEVDQMLVAHGQKASPPFELFKLEQQRLTSEFRPEMEQAMLRRSNAEASWNEFVNADVSGYRQKIATTQTAIRVAESQRQTAQTAMSDHQDWLAGLAIKFGGVLIVSVLVIGFVFMMKSLGDAGGSPVTILVVLGMIGVVCIAAITSLGSNANETFSAIGSSVKVDGGGGGGNFRAERMPAAPAGPAVGQGAPPWPQPTMAAPKAAPKDNFPPKNPVFDPLSKPETKKAAPPDEPSPEQMAGDAGKRLDQIAGRKPGANGKQVSQREREQLVNAFRKPPRGDGGLDGLRGHALAAEAYGSITGDVMFQMPQSMPLLVREYAHQRDPSLGEVRADFTETVYWHPVLVLPNTGKATVEFQLSDDIARYQVMVAGHTLDGRIGAITKTIEARKPFYLDPKLPLEISHTDKVDVPVRVVNDSEVQRDITFTTVVKGLKLDGVPETLKLEPGAKTRKIVRMTAGQLQGEGSVFVTGVSKADTDTILRTVKIVPDGFPTTGAFSDMIEGRARGTIVLPKDMVPGSLRMRLEVYPTSMADLVKGLDGLLREPYGCFEQTSTTNYPNTMILDYLNQTKQTNPQVSARAKQLLDKGYSKLTSFECPDSNAKRNQGFEWFGKTDHQHEALTAYGLLQFKDMARVHQVDPALIRRTQDFLLSRKDGNGGFRRNPKALDGFGGAPKHTTDAYIVWALVESDPADAEKMDLAKEIAALKAEALKEDSTGGKDAYFLALVANVLQLRGDRSGCHAILDRLRDKHLKNGAVTGATTSITRSGGRTLEIETTALAMLGWLRANDPKYFPAIKETTKWLAQQRGGYGAYGSTQSTVLALKALTLHAKSGPRAESGELQVLVGGKPVGVRKFTEKDVDVIGLDVANAEAAFKAGDNNEVEIVTDAKQAYPFSLSYSYTTLTPVSAEKCAVQISTKLAKAEATEGDTVPLSVTLENRQKQGHGMTVAIIGIPAGMRVPTDMKQLTDLREKGQISYFETRGRELILYWRELAPEGRAESKISLSIDLVCEVPGEYRGPASRGYLYYDADHKHWVSPLSIKINPAAEAK